MLFHLADMLFHLADMPFPTETTQVNSFPLTLEDSDSDSSGVADSDSASPTLLPVVARPNLFSW